MVVEQINIDFGNKVRELRTKLGISQEELAERSGLHRNYIGLVERAEINITLSNINKLAKILNTDIKDLF